MSLSVASVEYSLGDGIVHYTGHLWQLCNSLRWTQIQRGTVTSMDCRLPRKLHDVHRI